MATWLVRATWIEDDAEASHDWRVEAEMLQQAIEMALTHMRFQPHHIEARRLAPDAAAGGKSQGSADASEVRGG